jgi:hypothetical protein
VGSTATRANLAFAFTLPLSLLGGLLPIEETLKSQMLSLPHGQYCCRFVWGSLLVLVLAQLLLLLLLLRLLLMLLL